MLHLLDAQDRQRFEARQRDDAGLHDRVRRWEMQLPPIADAVDAVEPPSHVKAKIMARVAPSPARRSVGRRWILGLVGFAAAIAIAFLALGPLLRGPVDLSPQFQAELVSEDGSLVLVAGVIPPTHEIVIERIAGEAPEGRVLELWLIAQGSDTPASLGLLAASGTTRIRVPDTIAPGVRTGTVAISEEPPGGSPSGVPTGDVLATATFEDL